MSPLSRVGGDNVVTDLLCPPPAGRDDPAPVFPAALILQEAATTVTWISRPRRCPPGRFRYAALRVTDGYATWRRLR